MAGTYRNPLNPTLSQYTTAVTIALEGTCYAGKTTLARAMADHLGVPVVPEYADLAPLPPFPPTDAGEVGAALDHLLDVEAQRAALIRAASSPLVLLDRSPLSCIAFQHAVSGLGVPCDHRSFATAFTEAALVGRAISPAAYIHLRVDPEVTRQRQQHRGPVMPCLMDPCVVSRLDRVYDQFLNALPSTRRLVVDGGQPLNELVAAACAFATAVADDSDGDTNTTVWLGLADLRENEEIAR